MSKVQLILLFLTLVSFTLAGRCISKSSVYASSCSGQSIDDFDKFCVDPSNPYVIYCMKCTPDWFFECSCDDCSVKVASGGIAVIVISVLVGLGLIVGAIICCCCNCSGCPMYESRNRRRNQDINQSLVRPQGQVVVTASPAGKFT
eukprot:c47442_g1_i1.p1 GENE.c47442_g1_i1~~c47442_g1_i1.p1  ORF type:complete len:146 (+),score=6.45 c47442_g1_i1:41-478(+)